MLRKTTFKLLMVVNFSSMVFYLVFLATPRLFNVEVISQNNLTVAWSNDDNTGTEIKFLLCWMKNGEANRCRDESFSENKISRSISGLQTATKYIISVARYSKDGKTLGEIRQKAVITRSG